MDTRARTVFDAIHAARNFSHSEFPETIEGLQPAFIDQLQLFRTALNRRIHPSPNPGGWVRRTGNPNSRHHINQADAGDVFCEGNALDAFLIAMRFFNGCGVYWDTRFRNHFWPMLHLDMRPGKPMTWCRHEGVMIYPGRSEQESQDFWSLAWQYAEGDMP
jgi:hypothetical protein